jgi:hypothetical protein
MRTVTIAFLYLCALWKLRKVILVLLVIDLVIMFLGLVANFVNGIIN